MRMTLALLMVAGLGVATPAAADITNFNIIYNLQLRSALNHFKEDCRLARNLIEVGQQVGQDGSARAAEVMNKALGELSEKIDFTKADMDVAFKSFLGSKGGLRYLVAGQEVFWVSHANYNIKEYLIQGIKAMRVKLFSQANGDKSSKFNRHFTDVDTLERLTTSMEQEDDVMRNRAGEELKRRTSKPQPADDGEEPMTPPEQPQPGQ